MEASDPLANEKLMTPVTMITVQNIFSCQVEIVISPYPTVVIVVMVK